jgi:hypothetical protein
MSEEAAAAIAEEARSVAQAMATQHQQLLGALKVGFAVSLILIHSTLHPKAPASLHNTEQNKSSR